MPKLITTIITTYRRPQLLKRAVNSILKQTYPHFQVCVYDNASGDETAEIMQEFTKKDSRIKYHCHPENIGMLRNYEYAFSKIDTPFYSLLSDDDYFLPHFYETALQGFEMSPDAGFSACEILQMDESGKVFGSPLSLWQSEGRYSPPEGLLEMIKTRWRFPVPTGVLFQTRFAQNIKPNLSKEIELYWDPNYLLAIAARYPIVINKKPCGVFRVDSNCFSYAFYHNLLNDISSSECYLQSTNLIFKNIKSYDFLDFEIKKKATALFRDYVIKDVVSFSQMFIAKQKYKGVHFIALKYYKYFGFSVKVVIIHTTAIMLKMLALLKKTIAFIPKRILRGVFNTKIPSFADLMNSAELKSYHDYGKQLYKDQF